jgi:hypothetical protein
MDPFKLVDFSVNTKGSAFDVASVGNIVLKGKYRYQGDNVWEYIDTDTGTWSNTNARERIDMAIKIEVCQLFMERALFWQEESIAAADSEKFDCQLRSQRLLEICLKLRKDKFIRDVVKELRAFLAVEEC